MSYRKGTLAKATSTTTGTGTVTLVNAAAEYDTFLGAFGAGPVVVRYLIRGSGYREQGIGVWNSAGPNTLTRASVIRSSAGGSLVSLPSGTHDVYAWEPAAWQFDVLTGSPTLTIADLTSGQLYTGTGGTMALPALANLPPGIAFPVLNLGTGVLTIDPNGAETINDATTLTLLPGEGAWLFNRDTATAQWLAITNQKRRLRNAQTGTSFTYGLTDNGKHVTHSNAASIAGTLPQATATTFVAGFEMLVENIGAGALTITPTTSTINGGANIVLPTNTWALITSDGANYRAIGTFTTGQAKWPLGTLSGLGLARASTTTYTVAAGNAANENGGTQYDMVLGSTFTKSLSAFAAGSGNGSLDTGAVGATTWYHVHLIRNDSTGAIDVLLSLSATAPTMPGGYTARRRLGSILTNGSSQIVAFSQDGDEFLWDAAVVDVNATNPGTAAVTRTLTTPLGVRTVALLQVGVFDGTNAGVAASFSSLDVSDQAVQDGGTSSLTLPASVATAGAGAASNWAFAEQLVRTNTSSQIRSRLQASGAADRIGVITRGWIDRRGKG